MVERWLDGYDGLKEVERTAGEFVEGTREKELSELQRLLVGEERQRVVVVQGPFGIGKSCLLAQLCAKGGLLKEHRASGWLRNSLLRPLSQRKKGRLVVGAAHFFLFSDDDAEKSKSLSVCLYSIAHQLCSIVSGLREELEKIQDELETVDDLKTLFRKVLVTPLQRVNKMDGVVVVLDGMEALPTVERQMFLEILCEHWEREMPSWISVVVSSRPARKELEGFKTIKMEYESEDNKKDLEVYLKKRLEPVVVERELDLSESVKYVMRRAKGMFLYAREVTTQVVLEKEPHSVKVLDVCEIVEQAEKEGCGLDEVYRRVFQWLLEDSLSGDLNCFQAVASALAVARFPFPRDLVNNLTNTLVWEAFEWFCLVIEEVGGLKLPHDTCSGFLSSGRLAKKMFHITSKLGHETLVEALSADITSPLAVRHLIYHLCQLKEWDKVRQYMLDFDWLVAVVSTSGAAQQVIDDLDMYYNYKDFSDERVTLVVRAIEIELEVVPVHPQILACNLLRRIPDHDHPVIEAIKSSKYRLLLPEIRDPKRLEPAARKLLKTGTNHSNFSCFGVEGNSVIVGCEDGTVRVFPAFTASPRLILRGHNCRVLSVCIRDGYAVSGCESGIVRLWELRFGTCLRVFDCSSDDPCNNTDVHLDGDLLLCLLMNSLSRHEVLLWNFRTGERQYVEPLPDYHTIGCVALRDSLLAIGSGLFPIGKNKRVWLWEPMSRKWQACGDAVERISSVAISGNFVASYDTSYDNTEVRIYDRTGSLLRVFQPQHLIRLHSDRVLMCDTKVAVGNEVFDVLTNTSVQLPEIHSIRAMSGDLAISDPWTKDQVVLWHLPALRHNAYKDLSRDFVGSDKDKIVVATALKEGGRIRVFDTNSGECLHDSCFDLESSIRYDQAVVNEGVVLFRTTAKIKVVFWKTGEESIHFPTDKENGHTNSMLDMASFGDVLVSGSEDNTLRIWDWRTGVCLQTLTGHTQKVPAVSFDGRVVASGSFDKTVRLWDPWNGMCLSEFNALAPVLAVSVREGLVTAVTNSKQDNLRVWESDTGTLLHTELQQVNVPYASLTTDGEVILTVENSLPPESDGYALCRSRQLLRLWEKDADGCYSSRLVGSIPFQFHLSVHIHQGLHKMKAVVTSEYLIYI